jgi:hypothetical protein
VSFKIANFTIADCQFHDCRLPIADFRLTTYGTDQLAIGNRQLAILKLSHLPVSPYTAPS